MIVLRPLAKVCDMDFVVITFVDPFKLQGFNADDEKILSLVHERLSKFEKIDATNNCVVFTGYADNIKNTLHTLFTTHDKTFKEYDDGSYQVGNGTLSMTIKITKIGSPPQRAKSHPYLSSTSFKV